jgi:hypothetical protein
VQVTFDPPPGLIGSGDDPPGTVMVTTVPLKLAVACSPRSRSTSARRSRPRSQARE